MAIEIIEMFWKCKKCERVNSGIKGPEDESLRCPGCGNQKSDEPWLMPEDIQNAPAITDPALLKMAKAGRNWTCPFCGCEERNLHGECSTCGGGKSINDTHEPSDASTTPKADDAPRSEYDPEDYYQREIRREEKRKVIIISLGALIAVAGIVLLLVWLFASKHSIVAISSMSWQRDEVVEERHTLNGEGWESDMPGSSFDASCERRLKGYRECNPHRCNPHSVSYECNCTGGDSYSCNCSRSCSSNDNGTATCSTSCSTCYTPKSCSTCSRTEYDTCYDQCPIHENWCTYQYYRWDAIQQKTVGGTDQKLFWPGLQSIGDLQRLVRHQKFSVVFHEVDGDRQWKTEPDESTYLQYGKDAAYQAEWTRAGSFKILRRK